MSIADELTFPPPELFGKAFAHDSGLFWRLIPGYNGPWQLFKDKYTAERNVSVFELKQRTASLLASNDYQNVSWEVNRHGFRGPENPSKKPAALFVGSSVTFGWGVRSTLSFPALIETKLSESGRADWGVINAGVPGYSSYQCRRYLDEVLAKLDTATPRIIVVEVGINDGVWAPGRTDHLLGGGGTTPSANVAIAIVESSSVLSGLRQWFFHVGSTVPTNAGPVPPPRERFYYTSMYVSDHVRVPEAEFRENIAAMEARANEIGARIFFLFPGLYNEYGDKLLVKSVQFSHPREIPIVEALLAAFGSDPADAFLRYDEAHLSIKGHQVVADRIWKSLQLELKQSASEPTEK